MFLFQKFGKLYITTYIVNFHWTQLANLGVPGIWVGFIEGHPVGTYCVFNPKTKTIIFTKDITFLQKSNKYWSRIEKLFLVPISYEELDDYDGVEMVPVINQNNNINCDELVILRAMKKLTKISLMKTSMMKLKQPLRPLSIQKW